MKSSLCTTVALGSVLMALLNNGCADKQATALVVAISTEARVPDEVDSVTIDVRRSSETTFGHSYTFYNNKDQIPGTLTLSLLEDEDPSDPITVRLRANISGHEAIVRTATLAFSEEKTKLLRMPLRYACYGVPECKDGQTCLTGSCESDDVDVGSLPEAGPSAFPFEGSAGCFDSRENKCSANRTKIEDLQAFADAGCAMPLPDGVSASKLNLFVLYSYSIDQGHMTVLDKSEKEGWTETKGTPGFKLAEGLCNRVKNGTITKVSYNGACDSKTETMPVCASIEPTKLYSFDTSKCHQCVYAPTDCESELNAAKEEAVSGQLLDCAFGCSYDGHYDSPDECEGVGDCFFNCLSPYLGCDETASCGDYSKLTAWSQCLAGLDPVQTRCAQQCEDEGINSCNP